MVKVRNFELRDAIIIPASSAARSKEIEDLLAAHDAISQAFAIGLPDER